MTTLAEAKTPILDEYEAALARVAAYREQLERADKQADQNSLDRAADLEFLYITKQWMDLTPAPKNQVFRGRPVDPESRNRFANYIERETGLHQRYVKRLHTAHEIVTNIRASGPIILPATEGAIRPLQRLRRVGYADRMAEVCKQAAVLAEGKPPTAAEVKQAVSDFLAQWTRHQLKTRTQAEIAHSHRLKAQTAVEILWRDNAPAEAEAFHEWYVALVRKMAEAES